VSKDHKKEEMIQVWCLGSTFSFFFLNLEKVIIFLVVVNMELGSFKLLLKVGVYSFDKLATSSNHNQGTPKGLSHAKDYNSQNSNMNYFFFSYLISN